MDPETQIKIKSFKTNTQIIKKALVVNPLSELFAPDPTLPVLARQFDRDKAREVLHNTLTLAPDSVVDFLARNVAEKAYREAVDRFNLGVIHYRMLLNAGFSQEDIFHLCLPLPAAMVEPFRLLGAVSSDDEFAVFRACRQKGMDTEAAVGVVERLRQKGMSATAVSGTVYNIKRAMNPDGSVSGHCIDKPEFLWTDYWMLQLKAKYPGEFEGAELRFYEEMPTALDVLTAEEPNIIVWFTE